MAVTSDPEAIARAIRMAIASRANPGAANFAQQLAQAVSNMRNTGGGNPVGNSGSGGGGSGVAASTLAGLPQSPLLEELKAKGLIKEGMPAEQALAILKLGEIRGGIPLDIKTLVDELKASYESNTGDILTAGADWMKDLYGTNYDPNDPNAALFAQDPIFSSYAGGMAQLDETSDLNQQTDEAWFLKQQEAEQSFIDNLMLYGSQGGFTPTGGGGGGGGGGGRRGYGGGGGGGGGDGDLGYGDPQTTARLRELFRIAAGTEANADNPGFASELMANVGQLSPDDADYIQSILHIEQTPEQMQAALENEESAVMGRWLGGVTGNANNAAWTAGRPDWVNDRLQQWMAQTGITPGDDPKTPEIEPYYFSETFQDGTPNPLYGSDTNTLASGPPAGIPSIGTMSDMQRNKWMRDMQLFMQTHDPNNLQQSINPNGLQGTDLRDKIASIAGGVRDLARQQVIARMNQGAIGAGTPTQATATGNTPMANNPANLANATAPINNSNPTQFALENLVPSLANAQAPRPVAATVAPPPPQDPNSPAYDQASGMTWDPYTDKWILPFDSAQSAVTASAAGTTAPSGAPGQSVSPNPVPVSPGGPSQLFSDPALEANLLGNNTNAPIGTVPPGTPGVIDSGGADNFLQYVYPTLSPQQQQQADRIFNQRGIDTPNSNAAQANQASVASLLGNLTGPGPGRSPRLPGFLGNFLGRGGPLMQNAALFSDNPGGATDLTDLVNRMWSNLSTGDRMMELRPDVAYTLQRNSPAEQIYDASVSAPGVPMSELPPPPSGDYWQSGVPSQDAMNTMMRTYNVLKQVGDMVEQRNPNFNMTITNASQDIDAQTDDQITSQARSYDPAAVAAAFGGTGDFNDMAPDPLPGMSINDIDPADVMDMPGAGTGSSGQYGASNLADQFSSNNLVNRLINGLGLQNRTPAATTGIGSAGRPQPTQAQRSQVSNLAGAFKQAALKQQAAPQLNKIRSLLAGVKANFG